MHILLYIYYLHYLYRPTSVNSILTNVPKYFKTFLGKEVVEKRLATKMCVWSTAPPLVHPSGLVPRRPGAVATTTRTFGTRVRFHLGWSWFTNGRVRIRYFPYPLNPAGSSVRSCTEAARNRSPLSERIGLLVPPLSPDGLVPRRQGTRIII